MPGHAKTANAKQRAFAQAVAGTLQPDSHPLNLAQAYVKAGFVPDRANPSRLANTPIVKALIAEEQVSARARQAMTADDWRANAQRYFEKAWATDDLANVGRALELNAKALAIFEPSGTGPERTVEVLTALADLGSRMIANRRAELPPLSIEARIVNVVRGDSQPEVP